MNIPIPIIGILFVCVPFLDDVVFGKKAIAEYRFYTFCHIWYSAILEPGTSTLLALWAI